MTATLYQLLGVLYNKLEFIPLISRTVLCTTTASRATFQHLMLLVKWQIKKQFSLSKKKQERKKGMPCAAYICDYLHINMFYGGSDL